MVPLIGSFVPVPPYPVDVFPYIFLAYMVAGSTWLYITNRRRPGVLEEIEADLERTHPKPIGMGPIEEAGPTPDGVDADFDDPQSWQSLELAMTESAVSKAS
jgi:nitrate reductase gamma subunit